MVKHIAFAFIYLIAYTFLPPNVLLIILIVHAIIGIYDNVRSKSISLLTLMYAGIILVSYSNIMLISKISNGGFTIHDYIEIKYIPEATLMWCLGNTALLLGYELLRVRSFPTIAFDVTEKELDYIFYFELIFNLIALSGKAINLDFLGGGGIKVVGLLNLISIMVYALLWKKNNNTKYRTYSLLLCFLQTYIALTTAYLRQELLFPILSFAGGYYLGLGEVKYLFTYRILPLLFVLGSYAYVFKDLERSNFINIFYTIQSSKEKNSSNEEMLENADKGTIVDRLACLAQITSCIQLVNVNGFYQGTVSAPLVIAIIPRFIWPDKPQIRMGAWFAVAIGRAYLDENGNPNNSINMTIPGELYMDFGWFGIIIGCFSFGALLALFWNAANFASSSYNLTGTMWGGYLLQSGLAGFAAGDLQLVITFFSTYLTFYVIKLLVKR